jgi:uncharacterized protein
MREPPKSGVDGAYAFVAGACALTWLLATPAAVAWTRHEPPPPYAIACAGLSAFGPLIAAFAVALRLGQLRDVFGRWRTSPVLVAVALLTPMAIHALATALYAAGGGHPSQWLHPPAAPERWAALVVFPIGEEFGWRGFAHSRMTRRYGLVKGSLAVGFFWGVWHLAYAVTPDTAGFDVFTFGMTMVELPLYSLILAWLFERSSRSMAVAIAFHAGGHLDHLELAPRSELGLHALHLSIVAVVALLAARALAKRDRQR